jgi:hypothetical protein
LVLLEWPELIQAPRDHRAQLYTILLAGVKLGEEAQSQPPQPTSTGGQDAAPVGRSEGHTDQVGSGSGPTAAGRSRTTLEEVIHLLREGGLHAAQSVRIYSQEQLASWHEFAIYSRRRTHRPGLRASDCTLEHLESPREAVASAARAAKLTAAGPRTANLQVAD